MTKETESREVPSMAPENFVHLVELCMALREKKVVAIVSNGTNGEPAHLLIQKGGGSNFDFTIRDADVDLSILLLRTPGWRADPKFQDNIHEVLSTFAGYLPNSIHLNSIREFMDIVIDDKEFFAFIAKALLS